MDPKLLIMAPNDGERLNVVGDIVTIKATGADTRNSYSLLMINTPPGGGAPMHYHTREDEAFFVLEGEYELVMEEKIYPLKPGTFAYVPRETVATYRNAGSTWGRLLVLCAPAGHEEFMRALGQPLAADEVPAPAGPPTPEQAAFLIGTAAKYGVVILPPKG